jgi:hypothetical protein
MAIEETVEETDEGIENEFMNIDVSDVLDSDETPEAEPEVTDGPVRDEQGRFTKKEQEEQAAEVAAEVQPPAPDSAAAEAPPVEAVPEVLAEPFVLRVSGQDFPLEGAQYVKGEGLYVPEDQIPLVRQFMQEGAYYKQNWKTLESTAEKRGYDKAISTDPEVQRAKALAQQLDALFSGDQDALQAAYENWATQGPMYREKALREIAERQLKQYQEGQRSQTEEAETQRLEQDKQETLASTVSELKSVPDLKILTDSDWSMIDKQVALLNQRGGLFVKKEDGLYLDTNAIEEVAAHVLAVRKEAIQAARKADEANKFNAANRAKPGVASAPQVTPRKGSAPKKEVVAAPDARQVARDFIRGAYDNDDD